MTCLADDIRNIVVDHVTRLQEQVEDGTLDMDELISRLQNDLEIQGTIILYFVMWKLIIFFKDDIFWCILVPY